MGTATASGESAARVAPEGDRAVLVLCDAEDIRDLVKLWATELGFACESAMSETQAKVQLASGRYRCLVIDRCVPARGGLDSIRGLQSRFAPLRVVAVEPGSAELGALARALGANAVLERPLRRAALATALGAGGAAPVVRAAA